jgi:DnaK suppressor protein
LAANRKQIEELKAILLEKKSQIIDHVKSSRAYIDELKSQECKDDLDYAEVSSDSFMEAQSANQQLSELNDIDDALDRIDNDNYGICAMCDEYIAIGRLRAKPFANYCTPCREIYEQEQQ